MTTKTRITVPEGSSALVLPSMRMQMLSNVLLGLRQASDSQLTRAGLTPAPTRDVAGQALLALLEQGWIA